MVSHNFPTSRYCREITRFLDAIEYKDDNLNYTDRTEAVKTVHGVVRAYFESEPAKTVCAQFEAHRIAAVSRTISNFIVSCWPFVPQEAQVDIAIYISLLNILDDEYNTDPHSQMQTFWTDLFDGKDHQHHFWILMKGHLPHLLSHYGSFCAFNVMRSTFDYFQGFWMEQYEFNGYSGAECWPPFVRRLNGLGEAVGGTLFPASEFDEKTLFLELSCVMAQIGGVVTFVNDLFSYYKEYDLDEVNLPSSWCAVEGITKEQALERLTNETIRFCQQIDEVFRDKDPKILKTLRGFIHGYVTWHLCDLRYRLREVYNGAKELDDGQRFRTYFDQAISTGWVELES